MIVVDFDCCACARSRRCATGSAPTAAASGNNGSGSLLDDIEPIDPDSAPVPRPSRRRERGVGGMSFGSLPQAQALYTVINPDAAAAGCWAAVARADVLGADDAAHHDVDGVPLPSALAEYHFELDRLGANALLAGRPDGTFLVRQVCFEMMQANFVGF